MFFRIKYFIGGIVTIGFLAMFFTNAVQSRFVSLSGSAPISGELTCDMPSFAVPQSSHFLALQGAEVNTQIEFSSQLGGVGTKWNLVNKQFPNNPINILEGRSAAGAGWQFTSFAYSYDQKDILTNQSAGNTVGGQHGYDAKLSSYQLGNFKKIYSSNWTPMFSDSVNGEGTSPCPNLPQPIHLDNNALEVTGWPVQTKKGNIISIQHKVALNSLQDQYWPRWFAVKALYLSREIAAKGDLRVYFGSLKKNWFSQTPYRPFTEDYKNQNFVGTDNVYHGILDQNYNKNNKHILRHIFDTDYAVLVWNIFGKDIGIVVYNIYDATLRLNLVEYCSNPNDLQCGSIDLISKDANVIPAAFRKNQIRSYSTQYLVGTPAQINDLGFRFGAFTTAKEAATAVKLNSIPLGKVETNSQLPLMGGQNILENSGRFYSSTQQSSSINTDDIFLAGWTSPLRKFSPKVLKLYSRTQNGINLGFPLLYQVFFTNSQNSQWDLAGTYVAQPEGNIATIKLPPNLLTFGIKIVPIVFGLDDNKNPYFQLQYIELLE